MKNSFWKKIVRGIRYNYRERGLKGIAQKTAKRLTELVYDRRDNLIFESGFQNIPPAKLQLSFRKLSFAELKQFGYFKALAYPEATQERLARGHQCYGFFWDERLVYFSWLSPGCLEITKQFPILKIENGSGIYDSFTIPEFRRKGLHTNAYIYLQHILKERGEKRALLAVSPDNIPSIKGVRRSGFNYIYSLHYRKFLFATIKKSYDNGKFKD